MKINKKITKIVKIDNLNFFLLRILMIVLLVYKRLYNIDLKSYVKLILLSRNNFYIIIGFHFFSKTIF